ncbi:hypothetical protein C8J57DRAFT_1556590 [Mycena rebaudengoi]|nr:hypothetical protein C8J57DRAFT_1556590 [Mycena rebaudengoi]
MIFRLKGTVTSCWTCMDSPFNPHTINLLRREYGRSCSVCLTRQTVMGSQCAHLYASAGTRGQDQVDEARSLGLLDPNPGQEYNRSSSDNGTIQCPTCHLGYFTPGSVAFSPSLPILEWILRELKCLKRANAHACCVRSFAPWKPGKVLNLTAFIICTPSFRASNQIIDENGKFTAMEAEQNPRKRRRFRIFDVQDTLRRRSNDFDYTVPEVELAMQIYERLKEIRHSPPTPPSCHRTILTIRRKIPPQSARRRTTKTAVIQEEEILSRIIDALNSEDMTPSRPAHARTQHARPRITRIPSYRKTAYPTPSSLPKPEHDFGADYFPSAPNGANKPSTGRSFTSGASSPHSPEFSKLSSVANPAASSSNEASDYQPSKESENTDEWETDSDISSDERSRPLMERPPTTIAKRVRGRIQIRGVSEVVEQYQPWNFSGKSVNLGDDFGKAE